MTDRSQQAANFHSLHRDFLILPNAWDAASARLVQDAGAKAIATSSAAVAWSHGYADGHYFPVAKLVTAIEEIARVVSVPITCDAEGGYSDDPAEAKANIAKLIDAGAVGVNLEDGTKAHELHLKKIGVAREAGAKAGIELFINARTDVYLKKLVAPEAALEETIRRGRAILEAGASGLFVPGLTDPATIRAIAQGVDLPLNIMGTPGAPKASELKALGARRLSAATRVFNTAFAAARKVTEDFLANGDAEAFAPAGAPPPWNDMFKG